jgi:hypothetical protein
MFDFSVRSSETEIMDDVSRPENEFAAAYRELTAVNRHLGGIRAIERFLPADARTILDVAAGGCDVGETLMKRPKRPNRCVVSLDLNPGRGCSSASANQGRIKSMQELTTGPPRAFNGMEEGLV